jgi:hypothetical protein
MNLQIKNIVKQVFVWGIFLGSGTLLLLTVFYLPLLLMSFFSPWVLVKYVAELFSIDKIQNSEIYTWLYIIITTIVYFYLITTFVVLVVTHVLDISKRLRLILILSCPLIYACIIFTWLTFLARKM